MPQIVVHLARMAYYRFYKACLVEIEQTAPPLETNANAKFPIAENIAYQCMENGGGKHAHIDTFVVNCTFCVQC